MRCTLIYEHVSIDGGFGILSIVTMDNCHELHKRELLNTAGVLDTVWYNNLYTLYWMTFYLLWDRHLKLFKSKFIKEKLPKAVQHSWSARQGVYNDANLKQIIKYVFHI